jgi:2-haloacid dehalogenase
MTAAPLRGIRVCVFDAYGTLFDVHSAVAGRKDEIGPKAESLSQLWRTKQLEYTWLRALMGRHADFWQVTGDALDYALAAHDLDPAQIREPLMQAYLALDAYPEVPEVLGRLRAGGLRTAVLSNGEPGMLAAGAQSAGIEYQLDLMLSVEEVGIYKPHRQVYQLAVERLGVEPHEIAFQSSNAWDVHGAATFGMHAVWVNRRGAPRERLPSSPAAEIADLSGLPDLLGL